MEVPKILWSEEEVAILKILGAKQKGVRRNWADVALGLQSITGIPRSAKSVECKFYAASTRAITLKPAAQEAQAVEMPGGPAESPSDYPYFDDDEWQFE
jgi:hypothetical protein